MVAESAHPGSLSTGSSQPTDADLMQGVARGDRASFAELVDRHHQRVLDMAYRLSGDPDLARDVAQEAFRRLMRSAARYEPRAPLPVFLLAITRNLVREMSRKRRRRREDPLPEDPSGAEGSRYRTVDESDGPVERAETRDLLLKALQSIPERLREVFLLSEMEGLPYREIARICRCPIGTVASRKNEAVMRLRKFLRPMRNDLT